MQRFTRQINTVMTPVNSHNHWAPAGSRTRSTSTIGPTSGVSGLEFGRLHNPDLQQMRLICHETVAFFFFFPQNSVLQWSFQWKTTPLQPLPPSRKIKLIPELIRLLARLLCARCCLATANACILVCTSQTCPTVNEWAIYMYTSFKRAPDTHGRHLAN